MIKKENIKSEFERLVKIQRRVCISGYCRSCTYVIKVFGELSRSAFVALVALPLGERSFVVARSYPMSYKSAYRLVCSL